MRYHRLFGRDWFDPIGVFVRKADALLSALCALTYFDNWGKLNKSSSSSIKEGFYKKSRLLTKGRYATNMLPLLALW